MEVLQRRQITEVVTKRTISHTLEVDGKVYTRSETTGVSLDHMGEEPRITPTKVNWLVYTASRTVDHLSKKDVKVLDLEAMFQAIKENDRNAYNGNGVNHYDEVKRNLST